MMPPCSWATPGRNPGTSTKVTSGTLNASHVRTKRAALTDASMSSAPASTAGCWADAPAGPPPETRDPDQDVRGPGGLNLQERTVVHHAPDDVVHVVRPRRVVGHDGVELGVHPIARVVARAGGGVGEVVLWQVRQQPANGVHRLRLVAGREVRNAAASGVDGCAAERL